MSTFTICCTEASHICVRISHLERTYGSGLRVVRGNLFEKLRIERNSERACEGGRERERERFVEMQQGVRAVEAYRRTLLVDGVTSDTDSIAPVYKLEELCTLIRTSSLDIGRELLDRILKRLDHRSPVVKQKV